MPAIDFPAAPAVNDEYSFEGRTWRWNGTGWEVKEYPAALLAGTAANPSLYFSGDPNTGLYSPGADQVAISTGGTQRLSINANGLLSTTAVTPAVASFTGPANAYIDFTDGTGIFRTQLSSNTPFIGSASNHGLILTTNNTERLRITSTGNVGIGTSSPGQALDVVGIINSQGNATTLVHYQAQDTGAAANENTWRIAQTLRTPKSLALGVTVNDAGSTAYAPITIVRSGVSLDNIQFATGTGTERARIDASGRLLVGSSSSLNFAGVQFASQITTGTGTPARGQLISYFQADANGPFLALCKSRSNTLGTHVYPSSGDNLGTLAFGGSNEASARFDTYSSISSVASETWSATARGSELRFLTTANGATTPTERLRIDSSGNVGIGTSSYSNALVVSRGAGVASYAEFIGNGSPASSLLVGQDASGLSRIFQLGANPFTIWTNSLERLRITSAGNVGIGTSAPAAGVKLHVAVDADGDYAIYGISPSANGLVGLLPDGTNGNVFRWGGIGANAGVLRFISGVSTERARIDSSGRLLVGTSASETAFATNLQIVGINEAASSQLNLRYSNDALSPVIYLGKSRGATVGTNTIVQTGDTLGTVAFYGATGTTYSQAASIVGAVDAEPGTAGDATDMPGRLVFSTTADGASTPTERLRITSDGKVGIGTSAPVEMLEISSLTEVGGIMLMRRPASSYGTFLIAGGTLATNVDKLNQSTVNTSSCKLDFSGNTLTLSTSPNTVAGVARTYTERVLFSADNYLRLAAGTGGIQFNGDTAAANALDDYEEGTWTPTIVGTTLAGTGTYTVQVGRYTKVGNRVFFQCYVVWTAHTGTGNMDLGGLPFTTSAVTNSFSPAAIWSSNVAHTASNVLQSYAAVNSTQVLIRQVPTGGGASAVVAIDTAGEIMITGHYFV